MGPHNPLREFQRLGQSIWYDFIRRQLITSGELRDLIERDGVCGLTSNPAIFEKAIAGSTDYDAAITALHRSGPLAAQEVFEHLAIEDICQAADLLAAVYESTNGRDGYVSLEVSPHLANETEATITEARRLWAAVDRPNVMIKVPGTQAGIPAIRQLIGEGINVNVTLLFSRDVYESVAHAYIEGLEHAAAEGRELRTIASVASFFVSRIDSLIDGLIEKRLGSGSDDDALRSLLGKVAIANAKIAYGTYQDMIAGDRWRALAERGAQTQRLLWASTGTKNPRYSPTLYVDELVGPDTVNTVPVATLDHLREHGSPQVRLGTGLDEARDTMARLASVGISMQDVTDQLVEQGVQLFADAFDKLLRAIEQKRLALPA